MVLPSFALFWALLLFSCSSERVDSHPSSLLDVAVFSHLVLLGGAVVLFSLSGLRCFLPVGGVAFLPLLLGWYWFPPPPFMFVSLVN